VVTLDVQRVGGLYGPPRNCSICDLAGPSFRGPDGYIDVWDLMFFADHWHEGQPP